MMKRLALILTFVGGTSALPAQSDTALARAAFEQGRAALRERRIDEAVKSLEKAVALAPGNSQYHKELGNGYSRQIANVNFMRKAIVARRAGAEYNKAVELDSSSLDAAEARLEFFLGAPGMVGGGMDKAQAEAARIHKLSPYRGAFALAKVADKDGQPAKAEAEYRQLMRDHPDSSLPVAFLATFLQTTSRFGEAFAVIDERLAKYPNDTAVTYQLGRAAAISGQELKRGELALRKFLAMLGAGEPLSRASAHYRLGMIGEKQGDASAARAEYQRAIELNPRLDEAAAALKKLGK